ncbi:MAG: TetR/AcrR family transcriptional regulator [Clostridiales bacterium]|nr:TetR/AcrR family transcriptional regulator [Clostridiales bacterium]
MPPKIKFGREEIITAALKLTRERGIEGVNARAVAARLGCSTQPLFREFESMEQIKDEIARRAMSIYAEHIAEGASREPISYKGTGLAYIDFARREPELFKLLFMNDRLTKPVTEIEDSSLELVISALMEQVKLSRGRAMEMHRHMWIFVHGLAVMTATKFMSFTEEELSRMLSEEFLAMKGLYEKQ